jgi:dodecin
MAVVKVIEVISTSEKSIDDAVQNAVSEVSKSIRNIDSVYVKDIKAHVKNGKITTWGVICNLSFRVDTAEPKAPKAKKKK